MYEELNRTALELGLVAKELSVLHARRAQLEKQLQQYADQLRKVCGKTGKTLEQLLREEEEK